MIARLNSGVLAAAASSGRHLLIACDFDGTLCRIARRPDLVFLPAQTRETLEELAASPNTTLAIVSGRSLEDVEEHVALPLIYAGNHGLEIHGPPGLRFEHPHASASALELEHACCALESAICPWDAAWVERKRLTATVHYRNVAADEQHRVAMAVRRTMGGFGSTFALRAGKLALEVRPRVEWHKGSAVGYIRDQLGLADALCICIGDDVTDENMFRAFPGHINIRVGWHAASAAGYFVEDPCEVQQTLADLAGLLNESGSESLARVHTVVA